MSRIHFITIDRSIDRSIDFQRLVANIASLKIASSIVTLSLLSLLFGCGKDANVEIREPVVRPVKLMEIDAAEDRSLNRYPAVLEAGQSSNLSFQVGGLLKELNVVPAQKVAKGQVIARLDQQDFLSKADSAKAQYLAADEEYQRAVRLLKENAIAQNVLEQRQSARDVAKAANDSAQKALKDTFLKAPFDGVIAQIPVKKLQQITAGEVIATVINVDLMEVMFNLPASVVSTIQDSSTYVLLNALPDKRIEAIFKEADLLADATSQTYGITLTFVPPKGLLVLPGMNATVEIDAAVNQGMGTIGRIAVPLTGIVATGGERYVWVVDRNTMQVSKRAVDIEDGIGEFLFVTDGLAVGEMIVTAGANYLSEGIEVRRWEQ